MKLSTVMISSENPKKLQEFYGKFLNNVVWEEGEWLAYDVGGVGLLIGPHSDVKGKNQTPGRVIFTFETPDVKGEFDRISATGAEVIATPYHPGESPDMWLATFADVDGNFFQLASPWA
jgi:predicted enzyme related to lactoylglutathione lyase